MQICTALQRPKHLGVSQPQPFPFHSNIRSASWKGGSCGNPVTSGADWSCCSSNCKLLQVAWTSSGAIWQRLWRSFVMFCVFLAFVCNLEDLFNPITLSYLVLGGATCIIQVESWYVPFWSSSHLCVKMTKKLSLDFLFHPFSIVSQDKALLNMSWRQNQAYFGISPHCCLSAVKQFVHFFIGVKLDISDITDTAQSIQYAMVSIIFSVCSIVLHCASSVFHHYFRSLGWRSAPLRRIGCVGYWCLATL